MVFIRADANEHIGTGHVMRCLSIARAMRDVGEQVLFLSADNRGDILIQQAGFRTVCLNSNWTDMNSELSILKKTIQQYRPRLMLVDSYYVTRNYFRELNSYVKLAYIDDMNSECWDVDFLINYNIFAFGLDYSQYEDKMTEMLLGPQYAPLRGEFQHLTQHSIRDKIENVLVSAGGADPERITERILEGICHTKEFIDLNFHFIIGALNPRVDIIQHLAEENENVILHIHEQHMSHLMQKCDIAISAAGTTLYELCATGIPTITYTLADNQLLVAEHFSRQQIMYGAGDCREDVFFIFRIKVCIASLKRDVQQRKRMSRKMQCLVDGCGVERIVSALCE